MSSELLVLSDIAAPIKNAIVGGPFGSNLVSKDYVERGVPVIRGQNMGDKWVSGEFVYVSEEKAQALSQNSARPGDLVFTQRGTLGQVSLVPRGRFDKYIVSQSQMKITVDPEKADVTFLYYLFKTPEQLQYIFNSAIQTGVPHTNLGILKATPVQLPPLTVQQQISAVMNCLDDRITLLRETNATLEAIAQALFKSWFVDFDPVRAKQAGRAPEGMDEATAALFPDSFEESELGLVPKGWRVAKFGDFISRLSVGKKFDQKTALSDGNVPILDQGKSGVIGFHNEAPGVVASFDDPVVVFANHTCYMRLIPFPFSAIQNVLPFKGNGVDTVWAFYATKDRVKFSEYKGHWPDFAIEKTSLPDGPLTDCFRNSIDPLIRRMHANELQAQTLATLRDTLLPRLISGQLRLPEAEAMLAEV